MHFDRPGSGSSALRETTSLPPVAADGYGRPEFSMQDSAGHFYPIQAYVSIMTPLTRGRNVYHIFLSVVFVFFCFLLLS